MSLDKIKCSVAEKYNFTVGLCSAYPVGAAAHTAGAAAYTVGAAAYTAGAAAYTVVHVVHTCYVPQYVVHISMKMQYYKNLHT